MVATHYEVLGVAPGAQAVEIRRAYLRAALATHPDRPAGSAGESTRIRRMQEINEAWAVLRDPDRRRSYDRQLAAAARSSARGVPPPRPAPAQTRADSSELFTTYRDVRPIPRGLTFLPPAIIAGAILVCLSALLLTSQWLIQLGLMVLLIGVVLFVVVQLLAMARGARS